MGYENFHQLEPEGGGKNAFFHHFPLFSSNAKIPLLKGFLDENLVWLGTESNCRHKAFQASALPTELPSRKVVSVNQKTPSKLVFPCSQIKSKLL